MPTLLDQAHDPTGTETHRLLTLYSPPDYVKSASHADRCGEAELPPRCYADQRNRLYPCHTPAATWLSSVFFLEKCGSMNSADKAEIAARLMQAAQYFGIAADVAVLAARMEKNASDDETALPDSAFAYVCQRGGRKERHLPLRNPREVQAAASWFCKYRQHFPFEDRQKIAQAILARASRFQVELSERDTLEKSAGYGYCPQADMITTLENRAYASKATHPELAAELVRLADKLRQTPLDARDHTTRCKLAAVLDQYDRTTGLAQQYGDVLRLPEEHLFQVTEKVAKDFASKHFALTNGSVYEKSDLSRVTPNTLRQWFDEELAGDAVALDGRVDIEKLATIAASLPRHDSEIFERMLHSLGIHPVGRDTPAQPYFGLRDALAEMTNAPA